MDVTRYNLKWPDEFAAAVEAAAACVRQGVDEDFERALRKVFHLQGGKPEQGQEMLQAFREYCSHEPTPETPLNKLEARVECPPLLELERPDQFRREYPHIVRASRALKRNARPGDAAPLNRRDRNKKLKAIMGTSSGKRKQTAIAKLDGHTRYCIITLQYSHWMPINDACKWLLADTQGKRMKEHHTYVEQWLAQEYIRAGGEIILYDGGDYDYEGSAFAQLLTQFRKHCGITGKVNSAHLTNLRNGANIFLEEVKAEVDKKIKT